MYLPLGLFLPTSDLDLVIINSGCRDVSGGLRALANALTRKGMAKQMQVALSAVLAADLLCVQSSGITSASVTRHKD